MITLPRGIGTPSGVAASLQSYTTTFSSTQNPISESGRWSNGAAVGLDWHNCASNGTLGFGHQTNAANFDDAIAIMTGTWAANHYAQGTVVNSFGGAISGSPEVEVHVRRAMSAHSATGYEFNMALSGATNGYVTIVRWNGALGDFTTLDQHTGSQYKAVTGDVLKLTAVGTTITAYVNGVQVAQATDATFASGTPGMGFQCDANGDTDNTKFGFSTWTGAEF